MILIDCNNMKGFSSIFIFYFISINGIDGEIDQKANIATPQDSCSDKCVGNATHLITPCQRGCRFYDISTWGIFDESKDSSANIDLCKTTCNQAYEVLDNANDACHSGCELAEEHYKTNIVEEESYSNLMDDFMINALSMFSVMDDIMSNSAIFTEEVIEISNGEDHEFIVMSVLEPQSNTPFAMDKQMVLNTDSDKPKTTLLNDRIETNVQTNVNHLPVWDDSGFYRYPRNYLDLLEGSNTRPSNWDRFTGRVHNWWSCFSRKAGLPEIVLLLFWTSLMLLLVMSCCVHFNWKTPKSSMDGNLAVISNHKGNFTSDKKKLPISSKYFCASVVADDKVPLFDDDDELLININ